MVDVIAIIFILIVVIVIFFACRYGRQYRSIIGSNDQNIINDFLEGKQIGVNINGIKPHAVAKLRTARDEVFNIMLDDNVRASIALLQGHIIKPNNLTSSVLKGYRQGLIAAITIIERKNMATMYNSADLRRLVNKIETALTLPTEKIDTHDLILRYANTISNAPNADCEIKLAAANSDLNLLRTNNERLREEVRRAINAGLTDHNCERLLLQCRADYSLLRNEYDALIRNRDISRNISHTNPTDTARIKNLQDEVARLHEIISALQIAEASNPVAENLRAEIARLRHELEECKKFASELGAMM